MGMLKGDICWNPDPNIEEPTWNNVHVPIPWVFAIHKINRALSPRACRDGFASNHAPDTPSNIHPGLPRPDASAIRPNDEHHGRCVARAINGASGGTVGIANAYIADVTNSNYGRHQSRSHVLRVRMLSWDNLGGGSLGCWNASRWNHCDWCDWFVGWCAVRCGAVVTGESFAALERLRYKANYAKALMARFASPTHTYQHYHIWSKINRYSHCQAVQDPFLTDHTWASSDQIIQIQKSQPCRLSDARSISIQRSGRRTQSGPMSPSGPGIEKPTYISYLQACPEGRVEDAGSVPLKRGGEHMTVWESTMSSGSHHGSFMEELCTNSSCWSMFEERCQDQVASVNLLRGKCFFHGFGIVLLAIPNRPQQFHWELTRSLGRVGRSSCWRRVTSHPRVPVVTLLSPVAN